jgi:glycosyltransferase involved in cell wall biosynthesis
VDLSVVVPVLDERECVEELLKEIERACDATGRSWEVIFVDDGSTDGSLELLERLASEHTNVGVVAHRRNFGKAAALTTGFDYATGEAIVTLDGDGQDDPAEIPGLLEELESGWDLVCGWKHQRHDPAEKRWPSRLFNRTTARLSGLKLHDFNCGLKAYRGEAARSLTLYGEQHRFIPVLGFQRGWRITERAVNHRPRVHGKSKFGFERYLRGLLDLVTVLFIGRYEYRPLHLFGGLGLVMMLAGTVICTVLSIEWLGGDSIGRRPLLTLGVLLIVVGVQFLTLGLVGELITAARQEARGRPARTSFVSRVAGSIEPAERDRV